ncbi:MAG: hypothetical protein QG584_2636 [Pseudomonadota bacterium]|nr:hypothetical protein [Pseudomonadota bacterium]
MTFDPINLLISIPAAERAAAWKGRRLTVQGSRFKVERSREEEAATRKLRREIEAQEKAKREARFAALRERFGR